MNIRFDRFTGPECDRMRAGCNFTDEERAVFDHRAAGEPRAYIAGALHVSLSTVDRRIRDIKRKIERIM